MKNDQTYELIEPEVGMARPIAVDTKTAAAMLAMSPGTLENWRYEKGPQRGPRYAKVGAKVVYPVAELERFIAERTVEV